MHLSASNSVLLEICAVSLDYAMAAQCAGANRIELCRDLTCGGLTPGLRLMEAAREHLQIPIQVLIRPRPGDFCYSAQEFWAMRKDIQNAKDLKMDGVVVGVLDQNAQVDVTRTRELVEFAHPLPVTFHRAFDETHSWRDSLEAVIQTGAQRLLTSGCSPKVAEGLPTLTGLVREAKDRIVIMPGGGITPDNVVRVVRATSAREIHGSLLTPELSIIEEGANRNLQTDLYYHQVLKVVSLLRSIETQAEEPNS